MDYEKTTRDGLFTLTLTFNAPDKPEYSVEELEELINTLRQTADSIEFGMQDPSGHAGLPQGMIS